MCKLLSSDDYWSVADQLQESYSSDVEIFLDFILHLLRYGRLPGEMEIKRRARHLMLKSFEKTRIRPPSLTVKEVTLPPTHDYVGSGGFGNIYKGTYRGLAVALKVLRRPDDDLVSSSRQLSTFNVDLGFPVAHLSRGIDMAIPQARIHSIFFRNPRASNGNSITIVPRRKDKKPSVIEIHLRVRPFYSAHCRHLLR